MFSLVTNKRDAIDNRQELTLTPPLFCTSSFFFLTDYTEKYPVACSSDRFMIIIIVIGTEKLNFNS